MLKYKKLISALLAVGMMLSVTACSKNSSQNGNGNEKLVVGFSQLGSESDWRVANTASMVSAFDKNSGYELIIENAKQKQENQLASVRNFILQGVDIIVIAPIAETGWESVLEEAKQADIPVIIMDRAVSVEDDDLYLCSVGSDFLQEGIKAVEWLETELALKGTYGNVNILHLQGTYGATSQLMRTKALEDAVSQNSNWNLVAQLEGDYTEAKAYEMVRDFIRTGQSFDVLYSENDNMTFGAMKAFDEAGITYGVDGDVVIISFDAVKEALQYCLDGKINLCVECNPLYGERIEEIICQYWRKVIPVKHSYVEENVFEQSTLTQEIVDSREY